MPDRVLEEIKLLDFLIAERRCGWRLNGDEADVSSLMATVGGQRECVVALKKSICILRYDSRVQAHERCFYGHDIRLWKIAIEHRGLVKRLLDPSGLERN